MVDELRPWARGGRVNSPFALPKGLLGRLAGRFMLVTNKQDEVAAALGVRPGDRVLELGYGPGGLIRLLARTEAVQVLGVDPSPDMRDVATSVNRRAVRAGRVDLRVGTAEDTGLAAESVDRAVSVNNVALWPDLEAGIRELHRVVRPGGTVLIAWHGGRAPSRIVRHLRLPDDKLDRIRTAIDSTFGNVARQQLTSVEVFSAERR